MSVPVSVAVPWAWIENVLTRGGERRGAGQSDTHPGHTCDGHGGGEAAYSGPSGGGTGSGRIPENIGGAHALNNNGNPWLRCVELGA